MSDNKKIPLRELSTPVVERCAAALQTEWDDLDRGYPGGEYPAIRFATHLAASAALKALEDGMVLGIREDGKWLQVQAVEPFVLKDGSPVTLRTDGPVTGPDMVQVERAVLVELLLIAANTFGNNGYTERAFAMDQLHDDVASGERDVLTSADWLRRKGEE